MGYLRDREAYLQSGARTAEFLERVASDHGTPLGPGSGVLDWGCTTGRVLRHFADHALHAPVWGIDVDEASIAWAGAHLSPPLRFVTGTAYPHFPFEDRSFGLVFGISVMTHLLHLRDLWLLEIRRILRPGGIAVLTVHDEATVGRYRAGGAPGWMPPEADLEALEQHPVSVVRGTSWGDTYTFLHRDHIRSAWGAYLEVVDFLEVPASAQTAVVLRRSADGSSIHDEGRTP